MTEDDLQRKLETFGKITSCSIPSDPHTRQGRGFGFVTFEDCRDADNALDNFRESGIRIEKVCVLFLHCWQASTHFCCFFHIFYIFFSPAEEVLVKPLLVNTWDEIVLVTVIIIYSFMMPVNQG